MKHIGNLTITDQNLSTCLVLAEVTGGLCVRAEGAQFPKLAEVIALYVWAEGAQFPKLAEVTGWLCVLAGGAQFPKLAEVTGGRDGGGEGAQFPKLAEVTGALCVRAEGAQFPALGRVIAMSTWGLVALNDGRLSAGCRGPWTRAKALAHWGKRPDKRGQLFGAAIRKLGEDA